MPILIQIECERCRFVPGDIAYPVWTGKLNGGYIRQRAKNAGWQVVQKSKGWRFYCPQCVAEKKSK